MILKFIDREGEIKSLEGAYKSGKPEFYIVYGRRSWRMT